MLANWLSNSTPYNFYATRVGDPQNSSIVNDPYITERWHQLWAFENMMDEAKKSQLAKEIAIQDLRNAYQIQMPVPTLYRIWWPWVQNYHGEWSVGYMNTLNFAKWIWTDMDMKQSMGY